MFPTLLLKIRRNLWTVLALGWVMLPPAASAQGIASPPQASSLAVALSAQSPPSASVPFGTSGVVLACFQFVAGTSPVAIQALTLHRVGPGSQTALSRVYLYRDAARLTTGDIINSETQTVPFPGINVNIPAASAVSLCLVGDIATDGSAVGGMHGFEIATAGAITTQAQISGSFPVRGSMFLISSASAGTIRASASGSLVDGAVGQRALQFARVRLQADGTQDLAVRRIALHIGGSLLPSDLSELKMYVVGGSGVVATTSAVGPNALATFALDKPLLIARGQVMIVSFVADVKGRNGDEIQAFLAESVDLLAVGSTFGYGATVDRATSCGAPGYDGKRVICPGSSEALRRGYSTVRLRASTFPFSVGFTGPPARRVNVGQKAVHCLELNLSNSFAGDLQIKNWRIDLSVATSNPAAGNGLWNNATGTPNYTLIRLARINGDGSLGGSLLGPSELVLSKTAGDANDRAQGVVLSGSASVAAGATVRVAVTLDVALNDAMDGDRLRCTLRSLVNVPDAVRDTNGNQLSASSITPSADISGNSMTIATPALTVTLASFPSSQTYPAGKSAAPLMGLSLRSGLSSDITLKSMTLTAYVDGNGDNVFAVGAESGVSAKDLVSNLALYDGNAKVSGSGNIGGTGKITLSNLNLQIPKGQSRTYTLKGDISNSAPFGHPTNVIKFAVSGTSDVTAIDQGGQTVPAEAIVVAGAANGGLGAGMVSVTIVGQP